LHVLLELMTISCWNILLVDIRYEKKNVEQIRNFNARLNLLYGPVLKHIWMMLYYYLFCMGVKLGISNTKGRTQIDGVWEQGAEENSLDLRGRKWREAGESCIMTFMNILSAKYN
jgi:hypothetical protein